MADFSAAGVRNRTRTQPGKEEVSGQPSSSSLSEPVTQKIEIDLVDFEMRLLMAGILLLFLFVLLSLHSSPVLQDEGDCFPLIRIPGNPVGAKQLRICAIFRLAFPRGFFFIDVNRI